MRVRHKIIARYLEKTGANNGHSDTVRGIELEINTVTHHEDGPDTVVLQAFWMSLQEASILSVGISGLLLERPI